MSIDYKQLTKNEILDNLYIETNKKFPHKTFIDSTTSLFYDFYEYTGMFYYYKDTVRLDITKKLFDYWDLTLDEMIAAINRNTGDDFFLLPTDKPDIYKLLDKNGDSVERILLNSKKLSTYIRTLDSGFGLDFYPYKYNLWYVSISSDPDDDYLLDEHNSYLSSVYNETIPLYYHIDSNGQISSLVRL